MPFEPNPAAGAVQAASGQFYIPVPQPPTVQTEPQMYKISTSIQYIYKIPKCHQVDGIHLIVKQLDPTLTGKMDQEEAAVVVWILTRIRPDFRLHDLRCNFYQQLFEKYMHAAERLKEQSPANYALIVTKIQTFLAEDDLDKILQFAVELGFDGEWLSAKRTKKVKAIERIKQLTNPGSNSGRTASASGVQPGAGESQEQINKKRRLAEMEMRAKTTADLQARQGQLTLPMHLARVRQQSESAAAAQPGQEAAAAAAAAQSAAAAAQPGQEAALVAVRPLQPAQGPGSLQPATVPEAEQGEPQQLQPVRSQPLQPVQGPGPLHPVPLVHPVPRVRPVPLVFLNLFRHFAKEKP